MKKLKIFSVAAIAFLTTSLATAVVFLSANHWFGLGDLTAFLFWSTLLAIPSASVATVYGRLATRLNRYVAVIVALVAGVILGYASTLVVWKILGPWFGAFSFPVFYCWMAGAIAACLTATKLRRVVSPSVVA